MPTVCLAIEIRAYSVKGSKSSSHAVFLLYMISSSKDSNLSSMFWKISQLVSSMIKQWLNKLSKMQIYVSDILPIDKAAHS